MTLEFIWNISESWNRLLECSTILASLFLKADFLYMVKQVDICIDFLKGHVKIVHSLHGSLVLIPSQ